MRGVKRCFVYGKDHRVSDSHKAVEVTGDVMQLKWEEQTAFVTVEDMSLVVEMVLRKDQEDESTEASGEEVQWAE